jgi:hypothetical protein
MEEGQAMSLWKKLNPRGYPVLGPNLLTALLLGALFGVVTFLFIWRYHGAVEKHCKLDWQDSGWQWRAQDGRCYVRTTDGRWLREESFHYWLAGQNRP